MHCIHTMIYNIILLLLNLSTNFASSNLRYLQIKQSLANHKASNCLIKLAQLGVGFITNFNIVS